jgi:hypothetical protein
MVPLELMNSKLKSVYPMVGLERKIYAAVLLLIVAGFSLSISFADWQYFERSGSLIIIVGILLALKDMTGKINIVEESVVGGMKNNLGMAEVKETKGLVSYAANEKLKEDITEQTKNTKEMFKLFHHRLRRLEASILIIGTFIWGFGSLIGKVIYNFNA